MKNNELALALLDYLRQDDSELTIDDITEGCRENEFYTPAGDYLIYSDYSDAEKAAEQDFLNYIEEVDWYNKDCGEWLKFELERNINWDAIATRAVSFDGVSHFLNRYDGNEIEHTFDSVVYWIYRTN
jgi:hypothetical protein